MEQSDGQELPTSQAPEAAPVMFTGQQLLQQALAQHQALRAPDVQPQLQQQPDEPQQPADVQQTGKAEQTPEQQYQAVFHRLWKGLQAKVEDYHRTMTFKTGELLPPDFWGSPPQVLIMTVSPFGKIYQHTSEAFKADEHLKTMAQGLSKVLQSYQSQALTSSRVAAQAGAPVALQSIQKGKQRRKSDFSRQQALFGEFFRNKLMPKALAALAAKIRQASENTSDDKKKELSNQLEEDGFLLHKDKGCEYGCNFCREFRRVTSWPDGIPLLKNPASYQKVVLYQLCHHYNLRLEDLPEQENKEEGAKDDKQQRMTPGLEALLGVAEAHSKGNMDTLSKKNAAESTAAADGQAATAVTAPLAPQDPANGAAELPRVLAQPPGPMELHRGFEAILPGQANAAAASAGLSSLFAHFRAAAIPNAAGVLPPASAAIQNTLPFFSGLLQQVLVPPEEAGRQLQPEPEVNPSHEPETAPSQTDTAPSEDVVNVRSRDEEDSAAQGSPKRVKIEQRPE